MALAMFATLACTINIGADVDSENKSPPAIAVESSQIAKESLPANKFVVSTPVPEAYENESLGPVRFHFSFNPWTKNNFVRRTVPMSDFFYGGAAKDRIPAILEPKFETVIQADKWLDPLEPVLALELNGETRAYPVQILLFHELVNDVVGGLPVLISY